VRGLSDDGEWAFVEGSDTGVPIDELTVDESKKDKHSPKIAPISVERSWPRSRTMAEAQQQMGTARGVTRQDVFSLAEGTFTIQWPATLSSQSFEDLGAWLDILKRNIGRSINERRITQKDRIAKAVRKLSAGAIVKFEDHGQFIWFRVTLPDDTLLLPFSEDRDAEFYERLSEEELENRLHLLSNNRL
jgi:hypothetical protein